MLQDLSRVSPPTFVEDDIDLAAAILEARCIVVDDYVRAKFSNQLQVLL
jgi:hypothetical protein